MHLTGDEVPVNACHVAALVDISSIKLACQEGALNKGVVRRCLNFEHNKGICCVILLVILLNIVRFRCSDEVVIVRVLKMCDVVWLSILVLVAFRKTIVAAVVLAFESHVPHVGHVT